VIVFILKSVAISLVYDFIKSKYAGEDSKNDFIYTSIFLSVSGDKLFSFIVNVVKKYPNGAKNKTANNILVNKDAPNFEPKRFSK
jgi:hypothetical protein